MISKNSRKRSGQVWIETVIYTLIGIALIGLVLAILTPKIKEFKDRSVIEQTIESMNVFDSKIIETLDAPGNKRKITLGLTRGTFYVNSLNDSLEYVLDESNVRYSEPDVSLSLGRVNVLTTELTETYKISLSINYNYNITFEGSETEKSFTSVNLPYEFYVENKGIVNGKVSIEVSEGN